VTRRRAGAVAAGAVVLLTVAGWTAGRALGGSSAAAATAARPAAAPATTRPPTPKAPATRPTTPRPAPPKIPTPTTQPPTLPPTATPPPPLPTPAGPTAGPTAVPGADTRVPTGPPADVSWQVWHSVALPWSRTAGPTVIQGDAVGGFAHSPTGALLAAVHASARKVAAGDPGWRDVAATMLSPGPGRDVWTAARARVTLAGDPPPGTFAQVAGFQFVSYTADDAVLQLVSRGTDGGFGVTALHLAWLAGDWRLVLAGDGGDATSQQRAVSLAGFVAWGGV